MDPYIDIEKFLAYNAGKRFRTETNLEQVLHLFDSDYAEILPKLGF